MSTENKHAYKVVRPSQGSGKTDEHKPEDENAVPSWGESTTLGNEVTPSDVLKQQDKKK